MGEPPLEPCGLPTSGTGNELLTVLDVHTQIGNDLFYPAIRDVGPLFAVAHAEHRQIDDQLAVVFRTDPASDDFGVEVTMLAATIEHHASEEEHEMFPQSHALGDAVLAVLGHRMQLCRQHLRDSPVTRTRLQVKRAALRHF